MPSASSGGGSVSSISLVALGLLVLLGLGIFAWTSFVDLKPPRTVRNWMLSVLAVITFFEVYLYLADLASCQWFNFLAVTFVCNFWGLLDVIRTFPRIRDLDSWQSAKLTILLMLKTFVYCLCLAYHPNNAVLFMVTTFTNVWLLPIMFLVALPHGYEVTDGPRLDDSYTEDSKSSLHSFPSYVSYSRSISLEATEQQMCQRTNMANCFYRIMDHTDCTSFMTSTRALVRPVDPRPGSLYGLRTCGVSSTGQLFPRPQRTKNHLVKSMSSIMSSAWCHPKSRISCARNSDVNEITEGWTYDGGFDDITDIMEPWTITHKRLVNRGLYEGQNKWAAEGFDLLRPKHTDLPKRGKSPHWAVSEMGSKLDTLRTSAATKWSCGSAYDMHKPTAFTFMAPRKKPGPKPGSKKPLNATSQPDDDGYAPFHKLVSHPPLVPSSAVYATFSGMEMGSDTENARKRTIGALCNIIETTDLPQDEADAIMSVILKSMIKVPDPMRGDPRVFNCFEAWAQREMAKAKDKDRERYQAIVSALMEIYSKKLNRTYPKLIRDPGAEHAIFRSALMHYCATGDMSACLHDLQRKTRQWNMLPKRTNKKTKPEDALYDPVELYNWLYNVEMSSGSYSSGSMSSYEVDDNGDNNTQKKGLWSVRYSEVAAEWNRVLQQAVHPEKYPSKADPDELQRQVFLMGEEPWRITQFELVKILNSAASLPREEALRIELPEWFLDELTLWTPDKYEFEGYVNTLHKLPTFNVHRELFMRIQHCESESGSLEEMTDMINLLVRAHEQFAADPAAPKGTSYGEVNGLVFEPDRVRMWYNLFWCPSALKLRPHAVCRLSIAILLEFCSKNWRAARMPGGVANMAAEVLKNTASAKDAAWEGVYDRDKLVGIMRKQRALAKESKLDLDMW
ncbi:hypothetical protein FOL47_011143 [Perkinsus chesapeaki]|uniref:Uncharacterized protein n=1 Tax=Perkinsus chesapeaki TaxID=330153 RepID=A0A7J6KYB7_PERCH|nr:hypothetical protein FOL47_011143 [Perkinsus chesapeaki]